jgi:hypothetical protein
MAIKITGTYSLCSERLSNDLLEKAALWDAFCLVRSDFPWLLPFFWSKETDGPSASAYALALGYKCFGGLEALRRALNSEALLTVADALRDLQELGGHPVGERTLYVLIRLVRGTAYEDVLHDERGNEYFMIHGDKSYLSGRERRLAKDRAKNRVRQAKKLLRNIGINVEHLSPESKAFRELVRAAARKINEAA